MEIRTPMRSDKPPVIKKVDLLVFAFPPPKDVNSLEVKSSSHPEIDGELQNIDGRNLWILSVNIDINKPNFSYYFVLNQLKNYILWEGSNTKFTETKIIDTKKINRIITDTFWHKEDPGYDNYEEFCWFLFYHRQIFNIHDTIVQYMEINKSIKLSAYNQQSLIASIENRVMNNFSEPRMCIGFLVFCSLNCIESYGSPLILSCVKPSTARDVLHACQTFRSTDIPETIDLSLALLGLYLAIHDNQKSFIRFLSCVFHILRTSTLNLLFACSQNLKLQICQTGDVKLMGDCLKIIYEDAIKAGPESNIARFILQFEKALPFMEFIAYLENIAGKSSATSDNAIRLKTLESFVFASKNHINEIIKNTDIYGITFISKTFSDMKIHGAKEILDLCAKSVVNIFRKLNSNSTFPSISFSIEDIVFVFSTLTYSQKHEFIDLMTKSKHTIVHDLFPTILNVSHEARTEINRNADFITAWIRTAITHHIPTYKKQLYVGVLYIYLEKIIQVADKIEWKHNEKHPKCIVFDALKRLTPSGFVEQMSNLDITRCPSVVDICDTHIRNYFKEKIIRTSPSELIKKILESGELKIQGHLQAVIVICVIESSGLRESIDTEEAFQLMLRWPSLWIAVLKSSGNKVSNVKEHDTYKKGIAVLKEIFFKTKQSSVTKKTAKLLKANKNTFETLMNLIINKEEFDQSVIDNLTLRWEQYEFNLMNARFVLNIIVNHVTTIECRKALKKTSDEISLILFKVSENEQLLSEFMENINRSNEFSMIISCCKLLTKPAYCKSFWNCTKFIVEKFQNCYTEEKNNDTQCDIIPLLNELSSIGIQNFEEAWQPLIKNANMKVSQVMVLCNQISNIRAIQKECENIQNHFQTKINGKTKDALLRYYRHSDMVRSVDAMERTLSAFEYDLNTDTTFRDSFKSFHRLEEDSEDISELDLYGLNDSLEIIERVSISGDLLDVCDVLGNSSELISFIKGILDDDVGNLIDAVEEHSEQYVRESTVSDLIDTQSLLRAILKTNFTNDATAVFKNLENAMSNFEARGIACKVKNCTDNLHGLKALYNNLANRGEATREILKNIVERGRFHFQMDSGDCLVSIEYVLKDKYIRHTVNSLEDIRSRALLMVNSQTKSTSSIEDFHKTVHQCVFLIDTAFEICMFCSQLRYTGHFTYRTFTNVAGQSDLDVLKNQLMLENENWQSCLDQCRDKYKYLNFIHGTQLHDVYDFLNNRNEETTALSIIKFIDASFEDMNQMYDMFQQHFKDKEPYESLEGIGKVLCNVFSDKCQNNRPINLSEMPDQHMANIVQSGSPHIVSMEKNSKLVIHSVLSLYLQTTNNLPNAHNLLMCTKDTSEEDIFLVLQRSLLFPTDLFCLAGVERLRFEIQSFLIQNINTVTHQNVDFLLAIVCCGGQNHAFLDTFSNKISHPKPISDAQMQEIFTQELPNVITITSDVPGLGKTEYIYSLARSNKKRIKTLHMSGPFKPSVFISRLIDSNIKHYHSLHINVGEIENKVDADVFIFKLIVLGYVSHEKKCFFLNTDSVYIELANSINSNLADGLISTTCLRRHNLQWNDYADMTISKEVNSPVQTVCHYLSTLKNGSTNSKDLYFVGEQAVSPLDEDTCKLLLRQYFTCNCDISFTVVNIFLCVLADQLKRLSTSIYFRTSTLKEMLGEQQDLDIKRILVKALTEMSHEFASRSIQSCRMNQISSTSNDETNSAQRAPEVRRETAAEQLAYRTKGMIKWEDTNHLMVLFHQDFNTISPIYRDRQKVPSHISELMQSQSGKTDNALLDYNKIDDLDKILIRLCRKPGTDQPQDTDIKYALTPDNMLKMVLISLRIESNIPIVIMGETGCGKTSLIRYLAKICGVHLVVLSIHAGVGENEIINKVLEVNKNARQKNNEHYWLFLDEINTCDHLGLIADVICHKKCLDRQLAPNVAILCACNPYRLRSKEHIFTSGLQGGNVKADELSGLVYRVNPLPEALIDFVWDYGSLGKTDEDRYIRKMVGNTMQDESLSSIFANLLSLSQEFIREIEGSSSSVSLRDVDRCKNLIPRLLEMEKLKRQCDDDASQYIPSEQLVRDNIKALVMALSLSYYSRLPTADHRKRYREKIVKAVQGTYIASELHNEGRMAGIISEEQKGLLNRMTLPEGTAKNVALQENIYVILICILNKIPIFVVGKPGCSKSLSMQLIKSNLRGRDSRDRLFKKLPQLNFVSFQGSESCTSDGIMKIFDKAKRYQEHNTDSDVRSVVILDEIGLAEISPFNPLKVLHSLLEPDGRSVPDVAVVGISNWALDAAKMNRAIHLSRPDMDIDDLELTAISISESMLPSRTNSSLLGSTCISGKLDLDSSFRVLLTTIAVSYYDYFIHQKLDNFHGLRDFYSFIKYLGKHILQFDSHMHDAHGIDVSAILMKGLKRNFGGLPNLDIVQEFKSCFPLEFLTGKTELTAVVKLIEDNIIDRESRHLLLSTTGDVALDMLEDILRQTGRPYNIILGSKFENDLTDDYNYRMLSNIILCMENGIVLILKDLDYIYGSLYDMLNQNYTIVGGKKNCRVALGPYNNPMCHVHNDFRCIVLVEESKLKLSDPPFLNRFEKQHFGLQDMMSTTTENTINQIENCISSLCSVRGQQFRIEDTFPIYTKNMVPSIVMKLVHKDDNITQHETLTRVCLLELLMAALPEGIVRIKQADIWDDDNDLANDILTNYLSFPIHNGIRYFLGSLETASDNVLIFTRSGYHINLQTHIDNTAVQVEKLGSIKSEKQLSESISDFFGSNRNTFILQCKAGEDTHHLSLAKTKLETGKSRHFTEHEGGVDTKQILVMCHIDRTAEKRTMSEITYLSGWKIVSIDSIENPITPLPSLIETRIQEIILERSPFDKEIKANMFWAFTRIKYTHPSQNIERIQRLVPLLQKSNFALDLFENIIKQWIENKVHRSDSNGWVLDIACDAQQLNKSSTFIEAVESHIIALIRDPLSIVISQMEERGLLDSLLLDDQKSQNRLKVITLQVNEDDLFDISRIKTPSGPECYLCNAMSIPTKLPFSRLLYSSMQQLRDDFLKDARIKHLELDLDDGDDLGQNFEELCEVYTDITKHNTPYIHKLEYDGWIEDYIEDFCLLTSKSTPGIGSHSSPSILWAIVNYTDLRLKTPLQIITGLHCTVWTYQQQIYAVGRIIDIFHSCFGIKWNTIFEDMQNTDTSHIKNSIRDHTNYSINDTDFRNEETDYNQSLEVDSSKDLPDNQLAPYQELKTRDAQNFDEQLIEPKSVDKIDIMEDAPASKIESEENENDISIVENKEEHKQNQDTRPKNDRKPPSKEYSVVRQTDKHTSQHHYVRLLLEDNYTSFRTNEESMSQTWIFRLVNNLSERLLPSSEMMRKIIDTSPTCLQDWHQSLRQLLPDMSILTPEPFTLHALSFLGDLVSEIVIPYNIKCSKLVEISETIYENKGMIATNITLERIKRVINDLPNDTEKIQEYILSRYTQRCLGSFGEGSDDDKSNFTLMLLKYMYGDLTGPPNKQYKSIRLVLTDLFEDMDIDELLSKYEENSPLETIDTILKACSIENNDPYFAVLCADILQEQVLQELITSDTITATNSTEDEVIQNMYLACAVIYKKSCSLEFIASVGYIRQYIKAIVDVLKTGQQCKAVVLQCLNECTNFEDNGAKNDCFRFLMYTLMDEFGALQIQSVCENLSDIQTLNALEWDKDFNKYIIFMRPLCLNDPDEFTSFENLIAPISSQEGYNAVKCYLDSLDVRKRKIVLGVMFHNNYLRNVLTNVTDSEKQQSRTLQKAMDDMPIDDKFCELMPFMTLTKTFKHKYYQLNTETTTPNPQFASFLSHILILVSSHEKCHSIFYQATYHPITLKDRYLPGNTQKHPQSRCHIVTCDCGYRIASTRQMTSCRFCHRHFIENTNLEINERLDPSVTVGYISPFHLQEEAKLEKEVMQNYLRVDFLLLDLILHGCLINAIALKSIEWSLLYHDIIGKDTANIDDTDKILNDTFGQIWEVVRKALGVNDDDLCTFLHIVLQKTEFIIIDDTFTCMNHENTTEMEQHFGDVIRDLIVTRYEQLGSTKKTHYLRNGLKLDSLECTIQELPSNFGEMQSLFRKTIHVTKENFQLELFYSSENDSCPLLKFVFGNISKITLPRYLISLLKWHFTSITAFNYTINKGEEKNKTISTLIDEELDNTRKEVLKKRFEEFQKAWNFLQKDKLILHHIGGMKVVSKSSKIEECVVINRDSLLKQVIHLLVGFHNSIIDHALLSSVQTKSNSLAALRHDTDLSKIPYIPLCDVTDREIISFEWNDDWLLYSQRHVGPLEGRHMEYDFKLIEKEIAHILLHGKTYIVMHDQLDKLSFKDELYQKCLDLLTSVKSKIAPQEPLGTAVQKELQRRNESNFAYPTKLLFQLGTLLSLINKTKGSPYQLVNEYTEHWKSLIDYPLLESLLPSSEFRLQLCHVVALYRWLEEQSGEIIADDLDNIYRSSIPNEVQLSVHKLNPLIADEYFAALKVFIHRCLFSKDNKIPLDKQIITYLSDKSMWADNVTIHIDVEIDGSEIPKLHTTETPESFLLDEIVSPLLLVKHVYDTFTTLETTIKDRKSHFPGKNEALRASKTIAASGKKPKSKKKKAIL